MDRTPPTAADIKSLASDVARLRAKANEDFRVLRSAATEILFALDAMSERLANVPAVAPEDAFDVALHGAEGETHGAPPPDGVGTTFIVDSRALGLTGDPSADGPKLQGLADHVQRATAAVPVTQRVLWMTGDADHKEPEGYRFYGPELRGRAIAAVWNVEESVSYLVRKLGHCVLHVRYEMRDLSVPVDDYFLAAAAGSGAEGDIVAGPGGLKVSA